MSFGVPRSQSVPDGSPERKHTNHCLDCCGNAMRATPRTATFALVLIEERDNDEHVQSEVPNYSSSEEKTPPPG
jgi:hypothetical protein